MHIIVTRDEKWIIQRHENRGFVRVLQNRTLIHKYLCDWDFEIFIHCEMLKLGKSVYWERYHELIIQLSDVIKAKRSFNDSGTRQVHNSKSDHGSRFQLGFGNSPSCFVFSKLHPFQLLPVPFATTTHFRVALLISCGSQKSVVKFFESKPPYFYRNTI